MPALDTKAATATNGGKKVRMPGVFPWPSVKTDLIVPEKGCGLGDPMSSTLRNMAQYWREQIGFWVFQRSAVDGSLVLPGGSTIDYFTTGVDSTPGANNPPPPATNAAALWVNFHQNITTGNLFSTGAPVPQNYLFAAVAFGFSIGRPFAVAKGDDGNYTAKRLYCPWVDQYGARARDLMWSSTAFVVGYKDSACDFELGTPELYPPHAGQLGGETVRAGAGFGLMSMLPVDRGPVYLGGPNDATQGRIRGVGPLEDIVLCQDAEAVTAGDLVVPGRVIAYGDFGTWCGPCAGPTDEEIADRIESAVSSRLEAAIASALAKRQAGTPG